jgi:hypothetical protein
MQLVYLHMLIEVKYIYIYVCISVHVCISRGGATAAAAMSATFAVPKSVMPPYVFLLQF